VLPNLDDGIKMERMKNVVLRHKHIPFRLVKLTRMSPIARFAFQSEENRKDIQDEMKSRKRMTEICPNAEVVILSRYRQNGEEIRDKIKSRCKSKKFSKKSQRSPYM